MAMRRRTVLGLAATAGGMVAAAAGTASAHTAPGGQRLYLGSYTSSGGGGIGVAGADPATGAPTVDSWSKAVADPSWVEPSADGRLLYAVTESTPAGKVSALRLDEQGRPTLLGSQPTGGGPCHIQIHPGGRHLLVANYDGGSVQVFPILSSGGIGPASDTRKHTGKAASHAHQTVTDPTGHYVLAVDLGLDAVIGYEFDTAAGKLKEAFRTAFKAKSGPRHLAFHPNGTHAYVVGELDSTVAVCTWKDGRLTTGAVLSTRPKAGGGTNNPAAIAVSRDGRHVYVSNRGDDTVAVFTVGADGSGLTLAGAPSGGGKQPRDLALDPTGTRVYLANEGSGEVTWLALDPATGLPTGKPGRVAAKAATRVVFAPTPGTASAS
jgi:6-phosphogluconolactonase